MTDVYQKAVTTPAAELTDPLALAIRISDQANLTHRLLRERAAGDESQFGKTTTQRIREAVGEIFIAASRALEQVPQEGAVYELPELPEADGIRAIPAATVKAVRQEFLDRPYVPLGTVTLLSGMPGLGKSLYSYALAAKNPGVTLIATAEDALAAVARPRLEAAGADLCRVRFLVMRRDGVDDGILLPDDVAEVDRMVEETGANLVIVDPLMAHVADHINTWRDHSVRRALAPLHRLAEKHGCAVVAVLHLNKALGTDPLLRIGGSIGLSGAARSSLLLARDPEDPDGEQGNRRVLAHTKSNYAAPGPSIALKIEPFLLDPEGQHIETARITVTGESAYSGRDLLAVPEAEAQVGARADAATFLTEELRDGRRLAKDVLREAERLGISEITLRRTRQDLHVVAEREGFGPEGKWWWSLPAPIGAHAAMSAYEKEAENRIDAHSRSYIETGAPMAENDGAPSFRIDFDDPATWPPAYRTWLTQTVDYAVGIGTSPGDAERLGKLDVAQQLAEELATDPMFVAALQVFQVAT